MGEFASGCKQPFLAPPCKPTPPTNLCQMFTKTNLDVHWDPTWYELRAALLPHSALAWEAVAPSKSPRSVLRGGERLSGRHFPENGEKLGWHTDEDALVMPCRVGSVQPGVTEPAL